MSRIKIATYNAENFFDEYTADGSSSPKPGGEIRALAEVMDRMDADVIALQEVENTHALERVNRLLEEPYEHVKFKKGNSSRGIHLAFMSRFPLTLQTHKNTGLTYANGKPFIGYASKRDAKRNIKSQLKFQRDLLLARVRVNSSFTLHIFNAHLKSQKTYDWMIQSSDNLRQAESRAAAEIIQQFQDTNPEAYIALCGDFNEKYGERSIKPLNPGLGFYDAIQKELTSGNRKPYTYHPKSYRGRIDYMLLAPNLKDLYVSNSIRIESRWPAKRASDHFSVSAQINHP